MTISQANSCTGFVLAGGKSSRMGANKAFLQIEGQSLLERALATLRAVCGEVMIAGDPALFSAHAEAVADVVPDCGPLGGIHAALSHSASELNVMLAVDMPLASSTLLCFLIAAAGTSGAMVTVPRTARGYQPLCAVYHRDFASVAENALGAGKYKIDTTFGGLNLRVVDAAELAAAGFSADCFFNVNTPEDLRAATLPSSRHFPG